MSRPLDDLRGRLSPGPSDLTPAADVAALRRLDRHLFETAPGADPDWLSPEELAGIEADLERWGDDPWSA